MSIELQCSSCYNETTKLWATLVVQKQKKDSWEATETWDVRVSTLPQRVPKDPLPGTTEAGSCSCSDQYNIRQVG